MIRKMPFALGLVLTLVLLNVGLAGARNTQRGTLLPGETIWSSGASSYIFGTNDSIEYGSPNVDTLPSVQADLKAGGMTLMRTWAYKVDTDAEIKQRVANIENAGMTCMMMLGSTNHLAWMEHVVSMLGSKCEIYEFGNEPDGYNSVAGGHISTDTSEWIADVPKLRALNRNAVFGGPAVQYPTSSDGSQGSYPSDIAYFLAKTAAARVRADFISYHDYPCNGWTSRSACLTHTTQAYARIRARSWAGSRRTTGRPCRPASPSTTSIRAAARSTTGATMDASCGNGPRRRSMPSLPITSRSRTSSPRSTTRATGVLTCSTTRRRTRQSRSSKRWWRR